MPYENLIVETHGRVGKITLNRPKALNALNAALMNELFVNVKVDREERPDVDAFDKDRNIGCILLTGSEKAFAAGADIKEMQDFTYPAVYLDDFIAAWERLSRARKPTVAAVAGFALGGGCEIAMMCDLIIAADNAQFGQPEIKLGVMPGAGGTQRLIREVGKSKAMDMILTGRNMGAEEAERVGLVSRVVRLAELQSEAMKVAETIAGMSLPVAMMAKESVNRAYETALGEGIRFERRLFHSQFGLPDQQEGMNAFIGKRKPGFSHG